MTPPPASDFSDLSGYDDWSEALAGMLKEAAALAKQDPIPAAKVTEIGKRLRAFREQSPDSLDGVLKLDEIAAGAARSLRASLVNDRILALEKSQDDLLALGKQLRQQSEHDKLEAAAMRLDMLTATLPKVNEAIHAALELKLVIEETTDKELAASINKALDALKKLRESVEDVMQA
jgi:hypothetical protein